MGTEVGEGVWLKKGKVRGLVVVGLSTDLTMLVALWWTHTTCDGLTLNPLHTLHQYQCPGFEMEV